MKRFMKRLEDTLSAITFAEAGEHETARRILKESEEAEAVKEVKVKKLYSPRPLASEED